LHGLARVNWEDEPAKETTSKIITLCNEKEIVKKWGTYILKGMHCIWFNLNFVNQEERRSNLHE
jgi:hypothetical protein